MADLPTNFFNQEWRLNNLYHIKNKKGKKVKFKLNAVQEQLMREMWYLNIVLKARQLGMTTFIQIYMLDCCLFYSNKTAGVIAQGREYAEDFFEEKIKFAYDNLPQEIRDLRPAKNNSARELSFNNGSSIRVGVSLRSGTYQYLHISEFGKICAERPDRAKEIITGALNTVDIGQHVWIESTAEGAYGEFYEMVNDAQNIEMLTKMDYRLHFYPWFNNKEYRLDDDSVNLSAEQKEYFNRLEQKLDIKFEEAQKKWYVKKSSTQKDEMFREYPSTPEEAFKVTNRHAIFGEEMKKAYKEERICSLTYDPSLPVHLFYDLGRSKTDATCIWFMQHKGQNFYFIDFYKNIKKTISHYYRVIQDKGYVIGTYYLPHDGKQDNFDLEDYKDRLTQLGARDVFIVPRVSHINIGIEALREKMPFCYFDEVKCAEGISALQQYRYEYDDKLGTHKSPLHNWASHPVDALRQFAQGYHGAMAWGHSEKENTRRGRKKSSSFGKRQFV